MAKFKGNAPVLDEPSAQAAGGPAGKGGERENLVGRIQRAWRETLGAYATDEGETKNLLHRLVDFGTLSRDEAGRAFAKMRSCIEENRRELDRRVEESLKTAVARLTIPSPAEIERLKARVAELEARVREVEEAEA